MKAAIHLKIAALVLAFTPSFAFADPPPTSKEHWRNVNYRSHYILYDYTAEAWIETVDCVATWRFDLVTNELNTLTLYDSSRDMTVRLTYEGMWIKSSGAADFTFYQSGTFDRRSLFEHVDANGVFTGTIMKAHGCIWEERFPGQTSPAFRFAQTAINDDYVELYDGRRDTYVRLSDSDMSLNVAGGGYGFFKNGSWRR